jgi:hypothetical protein
VDSGAHRTLWAVAKMLGKSAKSQSPSVIENGFPTPFGINEPEPPPEVIEQSLESDPEKSLPVIKSRKDIHHLPPVDRGREAWACLLGAATVEGLMWGMC